ncbi:MAG: glycosyltransferase family 4 protein [Cyanobacteria bacterium SID2]|nr:glycosyltransferase family 4 protein [Cyanobacteria bacterium SID2]MBP0004736.1 glycosyltransferase family 4 protein [Cyanobacteria bacterium SBC]
MHVSAAIFYAKDGYDTRGKRLLGRQSAGEGFLKGWVRYSNAETLYCFTESQGTFHDFCHRIRPWSDRKRSLMWLNSNEPTSIVQAGALYYPAPGLGEWAWKRRFADQRTYSLCGITHTTATKAVMSAVGDLLIAPVQPWDALICTSLAVKQGIEQLLDSWGEYLAQRTGSKPPTNVQLPIIPLGVDTSAFLQGGEALTTRREFRQQLGIAEEDLVVLFVGRLISYAKAHPVPMYLAIERAARQANQRVHLIQAGWFESAHDEDAFREGARRYCPSVNAIFLDGRRPDIRANVWSTADIFISLSDNIQETFGLTPIEAMSAGLPVVVSDWNGYRESVRHEVDGFRVPTLLPPAGTGSDMALDYFLDRSNYGAYVGGTSLSTAIDVEACAEFLLKLMQSPELRQRLGENGRQRAREVYDWRVVVAAYEDLFLDLARQRASQPMAVPCQRDRHPYPLSDDPFRAFAHYATDILTPQMRLKLGKMASSEARAKLFDLWTNNIESERRLSSEEIDKLLAIVEACQPISVGEICQQWQIVPRSIHSVLLYRTISYLLKFDVLALENSNFQLS